MFWSARSPVAADSTSAVGAVSLSPDRSQLWSRAADFAVSESFATSSSDTPGSVGERCSSSPSTCQKGSCVFVRKLRVEVSRCFVLFFFSKSKHRLRLLPLLLHGGLFLGWHLWRLLRPEIRADKPPGRTRIQVSQAILKTDLNSRQATRRKPGKARQQLRIGFFTRRSGSK